MQATKNALPAKRHPSVIAWFFRLLAIQIGFAIGCGEPSPVPPNGLPKPPPSDFSMPKATQFNVHRGEIRIALPKDNPKRNWLKGTSDDMKITRNLPRLKARLEFDIAPSLPDCKQLDFAVRVDVRKRENFIVHASGPGTAHRMENGRFFAEFELFQTNIIEVTDEGVLFIRALKDGVEVDSQGGKVVIQQE